MATTEESLRSTTLSTHLVKEQDRKKALYEVLLPRLAELDHALLSSLLLAGNRTLHHHAERAAYGCLEVEVAIPGYTSSPRQSSITQRKKLDSIFCNPRLGRHVRKLTFQHATMPLVLTTTDREAKERQRQDCWDLAVGLIELCPNARELRWETGLGISPALWRVISTLDSLQRLSLVSPPVHPSQTVDQIGPPRITPLPQLLLPPGLDHLRSQAASRNDIGEEVDDKLKAVGQGGWGLGRAWENLEVLELANLSQAGAKTLTAHLKMLSDYPSLLTTLKLSTNFFDMGLLTSISRVGSWGTLCHLDFATNGTKLTAEGLKEVIEGCRGLESLTLNDIEGRLEKNTWSIIDDWPAGLRSVEIRIGESSNHHSWVLHHLNSIHHLPIQQLTRLCISRVVHPVAQLPYPPSNVVIPAIQPGHSETPIPLDLLEAILDQGELLENLYLDWWRLELSQMEALLKAIPRIRRLRFDVQASMIKVTSMASAFSQVPCLEELEVASSAEHNATTGPFRPCATSEELASLPPMVAAKLEAGDQSLPDVRDLRKFARRLPRLHTIAWTGRNGRGTWHLSKKSPTALLVNATFVHSAISTMQIWHDCQSAVPSFDFEDTAAVTILEVSLPTDSPARTDLPALTRTTTGNSSRTTIQTPLPPSPVASTRPRRRFSVPVAVHPSKESTLSTAPPAPKGNHSSPARGKRVNKVLPSPATPRTPQTAIALPTHPDVRGASEKDKPKKSYAGILENLTRHVPGSGRPTAVVDRPRAAPKKEAIDPVTIVEDEEDAFEHYSDFGEEDLGWTTVVKEKARDKVKIAPQAPLQSAKAKRKERKAKK